MTTSYTPQELLRAAAALIDDALGQLDLSGTTVDGRFVYHNFQHAKAFRRFKYTAHKLRREAMFFDRKDEHAPAHAPPPDDSTAPR